MNQRKHSIFGSDSNNYNLKLGIPAPEFLKYTREMQNTVSVLRLR